MKAIIKYTLSESARADQLRAAAHGLGCRNTYQAERLAHEAPGWLFTSSPPAGEDRRLKCASVDQLAAYDTIVAGLGQAVRPASSGVLGEPGDHAPVPIIRDLHLVWRVDIERIHTEAECDGEYTDDCDETDHWQERATNGRVMARAVLTSLVAEIMIAL